MDKFFRIEAKSKTECTLMLMQPAKGGSFPIWQMDMPIDTIRCLQESADNFLGLSDAGILHYDAGRVTRRSVERQ